MTGMSSQRRKLVYLGGILVLLIPIIALGMPATQETGSGGLLAHLRQEHDLGESTIGEVDPSSATMNLVLLGMRGVAANVLWMQAHEQQETKNWAKMRNTVNSIVLLQPHFNEVWKFQGWNLAWNVSAQWDDITDRFYWVKEGAKFTKLGTVRNQNYPELYWATARVIGQKIGRSDEKRYFRKYFKVDPDTETFQGRADPELNPSVQDNYKVAGQWYTQANKVEERVPQHIMMRMLFRSYPARSQLDLAQALQRDGIFEEQTRREWEEGLEMWTGDFGQEIFLCGRDTVVITKPGFERKFGKKLQVEETGPDIEIRLESDDQDRATLAEKNKIDLELQHIWTRRYQDICNYNYWCLLARVEGEQETARAHHDLYEGKRLFREGRTTPRGENGDQPSEAREMLESGMKAFAGVFERNPDLLTDDSLATELMLAVNYWKYIHQLNGIPVPDEYPLQNVFEKHANRITQVEFDFRREIEFGE